MFSGIVETTGRVVEKLRSGGGARLIVEPSGVISRFRSGESVAVSGVCLTALRTGRQLHADLSPETLTRTTLSALRKGSRVNLERSVRLADRLSGHLVYGHVDAVARVASIVDEGEYRQFRFSIPGGLSKYVVEKGSVGLDGISLTAFSVSRSHFSVAVIPHTLKVTTLRFRKAGDELNFEADVFAKYIESLSRRA
jgi:riboflavin synthase